MKLYRVAIDAVVYVLAGSEHEAQRKAEELPKSEDIFPNAFATEVTSLADVDAEWRGCIPFGGSDDTIDQLLEGKDYGKQED